MRRDELFDQVMAAASDSATWPDADRLWAAVIAEYRTAIKRSPAPGGHDERQLARALWRHASLLAVLGRPGEAADAGREAVAVFTRLHNATAAPDRDEISGELLTAMADLAGFEHTAGRPGAVSDVLRRAAELGLAQAPNPLAAEPHTKAAMGLVYHNYATLLIGGPHDRDDLVQAAMMASLAIDIRRSALDENSAVTFHDLASTCLVCARCLAEMGDHERLAAVVRLAEDLINRLGPLGGDLRAQLASITARPRYRPCRASQPAECPPNRPLAGAGGAGRDTDQCRVGPASAASVSHVAGLDRVDQHPDHLGRGVLIAIAGPPLATALLYAVRMSPWSWELKVLYLTICSLDPTGKGRARWSNRWKAALNAFDVAFDGRAIAGRR